MAVPYAPAQDKGTRIRNVERYGHQTMDAQDAVELGRQALLITLYIGAPVLIAGMVVGLLVGLIQALTQIQEQTVAFVPKIVAMVLTLCLTLPWALTQMVEYTHELISNIPNML